MKIDKATMTFEDLTDGEASTLRALVESLVVYGKIDSEIHPFFEFWRQELGFDDRQGLLLLSTAFPQRVMLSLLRRAGV